MLPNTPPAYATSFLRRVSRAGWVEVEPGEGHGSHRELAASPGLPTGVTAVAPEGGDRTGLLSVPRSIAPATPWLPLSTDGKGRQPQGAKGRIGCYPKQQRWAVAPDGGGGGGCLRPGNTAVPLAKVGTGGNRN